MEKKTFIPVKILSYKHPDIWYRKKVGEIIWVIEELRDETFTYQKQSDYPVFLSDISHSLLCLNCDGLGRIIDPSKKLSENPIRMVCPVCQGCGYDEQLV